MFWRQYSRELEKQGLQSLPIVLLISVFIGAILTIQAKTNTENPLLPTYITGLLTRDTLLLEFSSTILCLILAGKVGSNIASEIGTMRVTEQIDALTTLSTNPFKYLVVPRILAGIIMLPVLVLIGDVIGIYGGYLICIYKLDFNMTNYLRNTWNFMQSVDIVSGMTKAAVFGFIVTLMGCYNGFYSKGGAEGVGKATTSAVVASSILILISNYMLTELFFSK